MSWLSLMDKLFNVEIVSDADLRFEEKIKTFNRTANDFTNFLKERNQILDKTLKLNEILLSKEEDLSDKEREIQSINDELFEEFMTTPMTWEEFAERHDRVLEMVANL